MKIENVKSNTPKLEINAVKCPANQKVRKVAELHYHDELEFLPIYSGRFCCTVDGVDHIAEAGDIIFINSGVPHETSCLAEGTQNGLLQFRESAYTASEIRKIIKYSVKFQNLDGEQVRILKSKELFDLIDQIMTECSEKNDAYEIFVRSHVLGIIGYLYRNGILSNGEQVFASSAIQKILPVMTYINQNFADDLSLEDMSAMLGFDRSYFCRIFKTATGATFTEYLNFVRICKAEKKLCDGEKSILDISSEVGFSSVSYFNKVFKKYKNCSPSFYRSAKYAKNL